MRSLAVNARGLCVVSSRVCAQELERNMELINGSHQRQLAAERKRALAAQEEMKSLQKELEQLANKLRVLTDWRSAHSPVNDTRNPQFQ